MASLASRLFAASPLLIPFFTACDQSRAHGTVVLRDSSGIAIVENALPRTVPSLATSGPVLTIGVVDGAAEYELHDVSGVVRLTDGRIALATGRTEIRWYDSRGGFRQSAGGRGSGPGEFQNIRYLARLRGDSLLVFDSGTRRATVLSPDGAYVRDQMWHPDEERPLAVVAALRDGTLLTRTVSAPPPVATPVYRPQMEFAVAGRGTVRALRSYPGPEAALHAGGSGGGIGSVFISVLPFARSVHAVAGPDRFFIGSSETFQIDVWDAAGRLVRIISLAVPVTPVTEQLRQAYVDAELERRRLAAAERRRPFDEAAQRQELVAQRHAPAVPAYAALLATADGGVWARDFVMPHADPAPERWTTFDADGRLVGVIELPLRFSPYDVEGEMVVGVFRDSMDVQHVHAYTFDF